MPDRIITLADHTEISLRCRPDGTFLGLGAVRVRGVDLRSATYPVRIRLDTPDGIIYPRLILKEVATGADGAVEIRCLAQGVDWGRCEYHDDYAQGLYALPATADEIEDELILVLAPARREVGGVACEGFSQQVRFRSQHRRIHRILVHATWEIGGSVAGNTLLSQGQCNRPVWRGSREDMFTTACLRTLGGYGGWQGNSFQLGPRAGLVQGFDFQHHAAGALIQFWPDFSTISSLVESRPGEDVLHVVDEYRCELASQVATTPKLTLFARGALADHQARDLWWETRRLVYGGIRAQAGIAATVVRPEVRIRDRTRLEGDRVMVDIDGEWVESRQVFAITAERIIPRLAAQGLKRFWPQTASESDAVLLGLRRKLDGGVHGDLHCASVCATHRYFPSEFWGGIRGWKLMADAAHRHGMEIGAWFSQHYSPRAPVYAEHPEWRMIDQTGQPAGGGYGKDTLVVADWNSGIADYTFADLKRWKEEGGLDFLWTDSYSNMGLLQQNFAAGMRSNHQAFARFLARLQGIGIRGHQFEGTTALGIANFLLPDLKSGPEEQNRAVAGQNDFGWWCGEEDMADGCWFNVINRVRSDAEYARLLFRAIAFRSYLDLPFLDDTRYRLPDWWAELNHLMNRAFEREPIRRRMLPDGAGVRWEAEDGSATVFTFAPVAMPAGTGCSVLHGAEPRRAGATLELPAWGAYRF